MKKWDAGYLEVGADYGHGEEEEYIDLVPILENLYYDPQEFLKGTSTIPVRGYPFPPEVNEEQDKKDYLAENVDGRPRRMPFVLGTPEKPLPQIVGAGKGISTVVIKATDAYLAGIANTPAKSGVTVKYNLVMKTDAGAAFAQYGSTTNVPWFRVNVKDVPEKTFWKIQTMFENAEE